MFNDLVKLHIDPALRRHGFLRYRATWNRTENAITHVFDFQRSRPDSQGRFEFTLNVGILVDLVWRICWDKEKPCFVPAVDCFPQFRIAILMSNFHYKVTDKWWALSCYDDLTTAVPELLEIVDQHCIPFFDRFKTLDDVKDFCDTIELRLFPIDQIYYGILCFLVGDRRRYHDNFDAFEDARYAGWQLKAREIQKRLVDRNGRITP